LIVVSFIAQGVQAMATNEEENSAATDKESETHQKKQDFIPVLPYPYIVGQEKLKLALELAYIARRIGGVLLSGQRGTAKSTMVRAFASMVYGSLPITIPINATEDRVVGGWKIETLLKGEHEEQPGLLEQAHEKLLYVDEINLLDDHIVNIILDVTATGILVIQREGLDKQRRADFTLVGTMNPEEGGLRPQLLDRFGLMVQVEAVEGLADRQSILRTVLQYDEAVDKYKQEKEQQRNQEPQVAFFEDAKPQMAKIKQQLEDARSCLYRIEVPEKIVRLCTHIVQEFKAEGHRGDYIMALAARAYAARAYAAKERAKPEVVVSDVQSVAEFVLRHRMPRSAVLTSTLWGEQEEGRLKEITDSLMNSNV
jgi:magnesium chelatase subunit I